MGANRCNQGIGSHAAHSASAERTSWLGEVEFEQGPHTGRDENTSSANSGLKGKPVARSTSGPASDAYDFFYPHHRQSMCVFVCVYVCSSYTS